MNASRLIILGVAVAAAGGAGYIAKNMAAAPPPKVVMEAGPSQPEVALTEVAVLRRDLPMGGKIEDHLRWQPWPTDAITDNFITRARIRTRSRNCRAPSPASRMLTGEPMQRSSWVNKGDSFMSSILPSGKLAVATRVAADTQAGGFILPKRLGRRHHDAPGRRGIGRLGRLRHRDDPQEHPRAGDRPAIQVDQDGNRTKVGDTATLELTPQQAEIITVASQMADRLTLALRSINDVNEKAFRRGRLPRFRKRTSRNDPSDQVRRL